MTMRILTITDAVAELRYHMRDEEVIEIVLDTLRERLRRRVRIPDYKAPFWGDHSPAAPKTTSRRP